MIYTNKHDLPAPIVEAVRRDPYSKGDADFSVTELIESPRIHVLRLRHHDEIERDVADMVFSLLGRAVHGLLERYGRRAGLADYVEQRCFASVGGFRISGGMDLQIEGGDLSTIVDWKLTTAKSAFGGKIEWERQLNLYAWLYAQQNGKQPDALMVCAIIRDWKKEMAQSKPDYPQAPIKKIPVALWSPEQQDAYVRERVAIQAAARASEAFGDDPPLCSDEERWKRDGTWALLKVGNKRATGVFKTQEEAEAALAEALAKPVKGRKSAAPESSFTIDHRPALPHRCLNYCDVAPFCSQWQAELATLNPTDLQTDEIE